MQSELVRATVKIKQDTAARDKHGERKTNNDESNKRYTMIDGAPTTHSPSRASDITIHAGEHGALLLVFARKASDGLLELLHEPQQLLQLSLQLLLLPASQLLQCLWQLGDETEHRHELPNDLDHVLALALERLQKAGGAIGRGQEVDGGKDTAMRERQLYFAFVGGVLVVLLLPIRCMCVWQRESETGGRDKEPFDCSMPQKQKTLKHKGRTEQKLLRERNDNRTRNVPEGIHERRSDRANARNRRH